MKAIHNYVYIKSIMSNSVNNSIEMNVYLLEDNMFDQFHKQTQTHTATDTLCSSS